MNHSNDRHLEVERLLRADRTPEPPADLAARIKAEIPQDLGWVTSAEDGVVATRNVAGRRWWPLAAVLVAALGGTFLTMRMIQDPPAMPDSVVTPAGVRVAPEAEAPQGDPATLGDRSTSRGAGPETAEEPAATIVGNDEKKSTATAGTFTPTASDDQKQEIQEQLRDLMKIAESEARRREAQSAPASPPAPERSRELNRLQAAPPRVDANAGPGRSAETQRGAPSEPQVLDEEIAVITTEPSQEVYAVGSGTAPEILAPPPPPPPAMPPPSLSTTVPKPKAKKVPKPAAPAPQRAAAEERDASLRALGYVAEPATAAAERQLEPITEDVVDSVMFPVPPVVEPVLPAPFVATSRDRLSTFGLDVDTGSYTRARGALGRGMLPAPQEIRIEELVNRFDYGDAPPRRRDDFALYAEAAPAPFETDPRRLVARFHVRGRVIDDANRAPADLVFVIDTSGSMAKENRLGLVQQALTMLTDALGPQDRIALVTYGSQARIELPHTADHEAIREAIARLVPSGSTNAEDGLVQAYRLAESAQRPGAIRRVILCSDGVANVGRTDPNGILDRVRVAAERGVELTTVGFGMGHYNDALMEQLADRGNGRYAYVDDLTEAERIFVRELTGTLQTIAAEAKVQVTFDPATVARYRLLGYENRDIADEDFRNDAVDAGEIGSGHAVTALYELELHDGVRSNRLDRPLAVLTLRYGSVAKKRVVEQTVALEGRRIFDAWPDAPPALRLATLVAEWGEALREGATKRRFWAVLEEVRVVAATRPGDPDIDELVGLIARSLELAPAGR